jgi:hypothetical protein
MEHQCTRKTEISKMEYPVILNQNITCKHFINVPQNGKFQNGISCYSKTKYHTWTLILMFFLLFFCCRDDDWSDDESDSDFDNMHQHDEYSHSEIINQCNFGSKHLINAHLSSQTCLQHQSDSSIQNTIPQCLNSNDFDIDHGTGKTIKTFPTMLKLVGGTLVGGVKYSDLYNINSNEEEDTSSTSSNKDHGRKKSNVKYQHYHK